MAIDALPGRLLRGKGLMPESLALERQVGAMLLCGFRGQCLEEASLLAGQLGNGRLGGVILFDRDAGTGERGRNIASVAQLERLTGQLRQRAPQPLWIAVDQEGGAVRRLKEDLGFPPLEAPGRLGARGDEEATLCQAGATAAMLRQCGINLNLAPGVDLDRNPDCPVIGRLERSYSADPQVVIRHAGLFVEAHRRQGVATALKHFPGHGSSQTDSHLGLPDITATWDEEELRPFAELIRRNQADAVMVAHVFHAGLDPEFPATLSPAIVTGLLRERLGFSGVVVSDDLQMGAIAGSFGLEETIWRAVTAGVDLLTFGNNLAFDPDLPERAFATLLALVQRGDIPGARVHESVTRLRRWRATTFSGREGTGLGIPGSVLL